MCELKKDKIIIGITGMPGSGKSLFVEASRAIGYDVITMGDVIREETAKMKLEPTPSNIGKVMLEMRKTRGDGIVAEKCAPKIEQNTSQKIVVDGLRSYLEAEVLKTHLSNFILVAVHSSPQSRFKRLSARGRSDDPKTWEVFYERDIRELSVGIGNAIALADYVVINNDTRDAFKVKVAELLRTVERTWVK